MLLGGQMVGDENGDGIAQRVVVEGAEALGNEQRQEVRPLEQFELVCVTHGEETSDMRQARVG